MPSRTICRLLALLVLLLSAARPGGAATVTIACGAVGIEYRLCREGAEAWAAARGQQVALVQTPGLTNDRLGLFQQMLAAGSDAIDVFQIDVIWPGILGNHFIDLRPLLDSAEVAAHFAVLIENNTVRGRLRALPWFTDVGLLYYRRDLLEKYGLAVPTSWEELAAATRKVTAAEQAPDGRPLLGFVFQGKAYEGLTCNALEWIHGQGGGELLGPGGEITFTAPAAVRALETAAGWLGTIAPRGVLNYAEEEARGAFQSGHAVFMRNWPYAWTLAQAPGSAVRGKVGVAPLPAPGAPGGLTGTLGGSGLAVSRYSAHPALAADLVRYLAGPAEQARRLREGGFNPTLRALYDDPALSRANPVLAVLARVLPHAVARPARQAGVKYNRFSHTFWNAVHDVLAGRAGAREALAAAERRLKRLSRGGRW